MYRLLFPGSFDPPTIGHVDLINRSSKLCDELVVTVMTSGEKKHLFSLEERVEMLTNSVKGLPRASHIKVISYEGLLASLFEEMDATAVVRGLRTTNDYSYEMTMTEINRQLFADFETVFLQAKPELAYISSTFIREMFRLGKSVEAWVPPGVLKVMNAKRNI